MWRPAFILFLAFGLQSIQAQQVESHGVPASVLSPTSPGTAHQVPSSVTSPSVPVGAGRRVLVNPRRFRVRFGDSHPRRSRREFVPVPIFIPAYPLDGDYVYSQSAPASDEEAADQGSQASAANDSDALQEAYNRGAHDALAQQADSRYGEHYLDAREKAQSNTAAGKDKAAPKSSGEEAAPEAEDTGQKQEPADDSPAAVFIFKDGHRIQTQNYAIQGQTLFDFSNHRLTKIQLADLDLDATKKANDELGITLRLPPTP